jgi:hypothetical protein
VCPLNSINSLSDHFSTEVCENVYAGIKKTTTFMSTTVLTNKFSSDSLKEVLALPIIL